MLKKEGGGGQKEENSVRFKYWRGREAAVRVRALQTRPNQLRFGFKITAVARTVTATKDTGTGR